MPQIYCSNCGKLVPKSANFCRNCGAPQHGPASSVYLATAEPTSAPPSPRTLGKHILSAEKHRTPTIKRRRLNRKATWLFFFNYVGRTSILGVLFAVGVYFRPLEFAGLFFVYVVVIFLTARIVYNSFYFEINESQFRKDFGIIHKMHVTIPFNRIENINITRSVADRFLGLARIDIETAGSSTIEKKEIIGGSKTKAEGHLPGVTLREAMEIHDMMLAKVHTSRHGRD